MRLGSAHCIHLAYLFFICLLFRSEDRKICTAHCGKHERFQQLHRRQCLPSGPLTCVDTGYSKRMRAVRCTRSFADRSAPYCSVPQQRCEQMRARFPQRSLVTEEVASWLGSFLLEEFVSFVAGVGLLSAHLSTSARPSDDSAVAKFANHEQQHAVCLHFYVSNAGGSAAFCFGSILQMIATQKPPQRAHRNWTQLARQHPECMRVRVWICLACVGSDSAVCRGSRQLKRTCYGSFARVCPRSTATRKSALQLDCKTAN